MICCHAVRARGIWKGCLVESRDETADQLAVGDRVAGVSSSIDLLDGEGKLQAPLEHHLEDDVLVRAVGLHHVERGRVDGWTGFVGTPGYYAWAGLSFELVCLLHTDDIKRTLGVSGVQTIVSAWRSKYAEPAAQIDLLIDRRDDVINLCEMKYADGPYALTAADERSIRNKMAAFRSETGTRKAIHPVLITLDGANRNAHFNSVILGEVAVGNWLE